MKKKNWFLLDNAAKIFPCISNKNRPNLFSVSVTLVEDINQVILQETIDMVLNRFPSFKVKLKKGLFWYYLEENKNPFVVKDQSANIFDYAMLKKNNGYLFNLTYYKNKITLTVFHSLTDGTGGMEFLKTIVYQYLKLAGRKIESDGLIMLPDSPSVNSEVNDNFQKYYNKDKCKPQKEVKAFHLDGTYFDYGGVGIIDGTVSVKKLKEVAKKYNVTLTTYICSLFTYAVFKTCYKQEKPIKKPVKLLVPVNLRKLYNDETLRNFASFIRLETQMHKDLTLEEIILDYDKQMKEKVNKEYVASITNANVKLEHNWFLRITPLCLKNIAMRIGYNMLGDNLQTTSISNLGAVKFPESMKPFIENVYFDLGASYNVVKNLGISSFEDKLNFSFCRSVIETNLEREFFKLLTDEGIEVEIISNYWEKENEKM